MYIDWDVILRWGAILSALLVVVGAATKFFNWLFSKRKQSEKIDEQDKKIKELKEHHDEDMQQVRKELSLIIRGLSACLDGLIQQGCNHDVPKIKGMIDDYLNQQAHA